MLGLKPNLLERVRPRRKKRLGKPHSSRTNREMFKGISPNKVISPPKPFDDFPMVSALIDENSRRWKVDTLKSLFLPFEVNTILNIPLSYSLPKDKIIWVGNKRGEFSMKSAYYVALTVINSSNCGESSYGDPRTPL